MSRINAFICLAIVAGALAAMTASAFAEFDSEPTEINVGKGQGKAVVLKLGGSEFKCTQLSNFWNLITHSTLTMKVKNWGTCGEVAPLNETANLTGGALFQIKQGKGEFKGLSIALTPIAGQFAPPLMIKTSAGCEIEISVVNNQSLKEIDLENSKPEINLDIELKIVNITDRVNKVCESEGIKPTTIGRFEADLLEEGLVAK
jgi:hypothetical protein